MRRLTAATFAALVCLSAIASGQGRSTSRPAPRSPEQSGGRRPGLSIDEITIAQAHAAMRAGRLTCHSLVQQYLRRIEAYDKRGPAINAIVVLNSSALAEADDLDRRFKARRDQSVRSTASRPSSRTTSRRSACRARPARSRSKGFVSNRDAFLVKRIKDAGAIVLAKSNMAEFAFTPYETVSSILPGYTQESVRARSRDRGIERRHGGGGRRQLRRDRPRQRHRQFDPRAVIASSARRHPLDDGADEPQRGGTAQPAGGHRRTDDPHGRGRGGRFSGDRRSGPSRPGDRAGSPIASTSARWTPDGTLPDYSAALMSDGLKGARIGVLRQAYERDTTDAEIVKVFTAAIGDMKRAGATIVDPVRVDLDQMRRAAGAGTCGGFKYDINRYLAAQGDRVPVQSLDEIIKSRRFHPSVQLPPGAGAGGSENGPDTPACKAEAEYREQVRAAVLKAMDAETARRLRLPDVEQPAAAHRRSEHAARRQQPVLLTDHRVSGHQVPMGYTRGTAARRAHVLRPSVGRGDADQARLRLRAGHAPPACAPDEIGRWSGVRRSKTARSGSRPFRKSRAPSDERNSSENGIPIEL